MSKLEVSLRKGSVANGFRLTDEEVTALAAHLESGYVIIPKSDLAEVKRTKHDPNAYRVDGESVVFTSLANAEMWVMRDVAVWQFIANEGAARDKRRDELARDIHTKVYGSMSANPSYANSNNALQEAIDRIITLESAA